MSLFGRFFRSKTRSSARRTLPRRQALGTGVEHLEDRMVLSAAALSEGGKFTEFAMDPITVTSVELRVGSQTHTVSTSNSLVKFEPGNDFEVVGINYYVADQAEGWTGVVAFEGYLRYSTQTSHLGTFNYADGRFGAGVENGPFTVGEHSHDGLTGSWTLNEDTNRLSLALVYYAGPNQFEVHDRFFVNLQPGKVDLVMQQGQISWNPNFGSRNYRFFGNVHNGGAYRETTYSEVNIFRASDLTTPIWVGTFSATVQAGQSTGLVEYLNTNPDDQYSTRWRAVRGDYYIRIWVDPENLIAEVDETNNSRSTHFTVT